jgi:epoxyqueuosine reductase
MTPPLRTGRIKALGRALGLDLVGVAPAAPLDRANYYKAWLAAGYAGSMTWLLRHADLRQDPRRLLPQARSVICGAISCHRQAPEPPDKTQPSGRIASYARGKDYHLVLRQILAELVKRLREEFAEPFAARICVDTAPVLERELARLAGLGWIGKNTCLINPELGSDLLLGEIITSLDLAPDRPIADQCGRCARCLRACPAGAFPAPYQLNASRCVSYLTIEHRGPIPDKLHAAIGNWIFGCDVCQEVCPYNRHAPLGRQPDIMTDLLPPFLELKRVLCLTDEEYRRLTHQNAAGRATLAMWRRNATIALANHPTGPRRRGSAGTDPAPL